MNVEINSAFPTRLETGRYRTTSKTMVTLFCGFGDRRQVVECMVHPPDTTFEIAGTEGMFWYGAEIEAPHGQILYSQLIAEPS